MSTLLTPRRGPRRAVRREKPREQESLFAAAAAPATPAREAAPAAPAAPAQPADPRAVAAPQADTTASAPRQGPTLDDLVAGAWEGLMAGAPASCFVCGTPMTPRYSSGHAAVGGRCGGCGTTLG